MFTDVRNKYINKYIPSNYSIGKKVLLIHGFANNESLFRKLISMLIDVGIESNRALLPGFEEL